MVSRPGRWGNPYKLPTGVPATPEMRAKLVHWYRLDIEAGALPYDLDEVRAELGGKNLACWCPLDQPCHADVLLELANAPPGAVS